MCGFFSEASLLDGNFFVLLTFIHIMFYYFSVLPSYTRTVKAPFCLLPEHTSTTF